MFDRRSYPYLQSFMASHFFQTPDISAAIEDVVPKFVGTTHLSNVLGTRADILRFLRDHGNDLDTAFEEYVDSRIDISGFGRTSAEWLTELEARLAAAEGATKPGVAT